MALLKEAAALIPGTRDFKVFHFKSSEHKPRTVDERLLHPLFERRADYLYWQTREQLIELAPASPGEHSVDQQSQVGPQTVALQNLAQNIGGRKPLMSVAGNDVPASNNLTSHWTGAHADGSSRRRPAATRHRIMFPSP